MKLVELKQQAANLGLTKEEVRGYGDLRKKQTWIDAIEDATFTDPEESLFPYCDIDDAPTAQPFVTPSAKPTIERVLRATGNFWEKELITATELVYRAIATPAQHRTDRDRLFLGFFAKAVKTYNAA